MPPLRLLQLATGCDRSFGPQVPAIARAPNFYHQHIQERKTNEIAYSKNKFFCSRCAPRLKLQPLCQCQAIENTRLAGTLKEGHARTMAVFVTIPSGFARSALECGGSTPLCPIAVSRRQESRRLSGDRRPGCMEPRTVASSGRWSARRRAMPVELYARTRSCRFPS